MKKCIIVFSLVFLLLIPVWSAGKKEADVEKPVSITVAVQIGAEADAHKRLANEFERQHPNIKVHIEEIARSVHSTQMATALSGRSDEYDVLMFSTAHFPLWHAGGWIEPLDAYLKGPNFDQKGYNLADFPDAILDIFARDGQLFGLPQEASAYLLFYRKDILKKYGVAEPPAHGWSWDEYIDAAKTIQAGLERDNIKDMVATVFPGSKNRNLSQYVLQNIWANGGELLDDNLRPHLTTPEAVAGLQTYLDQLLRHKVVSPGVVGYAYAEVLTAMQQGQAAMGLQWNAAAAPLIEQSEAIGADWGFTVIPYFSSKGPKSNRVFPSIWGVGISSFSRHKDAAFKYITWFTSQDVAREYVTKGGGSSGRSSLLNDPSIVENYPMYPALLESMKYYHALPDIPEWTFILEDILTASWNSALVGDMSAEQAMMEANKAIEQLLDDAGYY